MINSMVVSWPCPQTRLERLASVKHSSLVRKFVTYDRKTFNNIGPRCSSQHLHILNWKKCLFVTNALA
jgi:hypothetical protein